MIRATKRFENIMTAQEKEFITRNAFTRRFERGSIITDDSYFCLEILTGTAGVYLASDEGRQLLIMRFHAGDEEVLSASILIKNTEEELISIAETDCELRLISAVLFRHFLDTNPVLKCYWYELIANNMSSACLLMRNNLLVGLDRRLAGFLVSECEHGRPSIIITQEELAENVGSVREVVTRMLGKFSKKGLVRLSRGKIDVLDIAGLRRI